MKSNSFGRLRRRAESRKLRFVLFVLLGPSTPSKEGRRQRRPAMPRRTIAPDGSVVGDAADDGVPGSSSSSARRSRLPCSLPQTVDTFGFILELKHFAVLVLLVSITMGPVGLALFTLFMSLYTVQSRRGSSSSISGGGGGRWKNGRAAANIKGVGDLPKPKGGG